MKNYLASFLFAFLLLPGHYSLSQQLTFNQVEPPFGRSYGGTIGGISQDNNGYMWFTTNRGLYRYDGYKFKLYLNDPANPNSLFSNHLETIYADRAGIIWIASTDNGLDRLNPQTGVFTHFGRIPNNPQSLACDTVRAIREDHEGNLWVGTSSGLDRLDPATGIFHHYQYNPNDSFSLSSNLVKAVFEDRDGILWVGTGSPFPFEGGGTEDGGLNRFDRKTGRFTRYKHDPKNPNTLVNNKVRAIFEDSKGVFWVGTAGDGLHTMDRLKGTFVRHPYDPSDPEKLSRPLITTPSPEDEHITFITEDASGSIWIGTVGNGLNRYDRETRKIVHFGAKDSAAGFTDNSAWCATSSRDGILWIASWEGNLYRIDPFHKQIPHIFTGSPVYAFSEKSSGELWIGTMQGLILRDKNTGTAKKFMHDAKSPTSLSNNTVVSIYKDQNGTLWIGTRNGLNRLNPDGLSFTRFEHNPNDSCSINAGDIYAITAGNPKSLWIGTKNGLDLMDTQKNSFTHFRNNPKDTNSLGRNEIIYLQTDQKGNLWIAKFLKAGLDYLDHTTGKFKHFFNGVSVSHFYLATDGTFWIGTENGLYKINSTENSITKFADPNSGIETTFILSILEDNLQNLWVSTLSGIYKFNLKNHQTTIFGANHGVNASHLIYNAIYKGKEGEIYIGDANGYYVISPDQFFSNPKSPEVVFTDFRIGDKSIIPGPNGPLEVPIEAAKEISLTYNQNVFSIDFAGISYSSPENNRHIFMLENYESIWHDAGAEKTANYYNITPGKYTFRVKAASSDGVWAEKTITITITPPWWRTWWAYCIYGLLFFAAVYAVHRIQHRRLLQTERERTRVREMAQAKEIEKAYHELQTTQAQLIQSEKMASLGELTAGIAHEIQNPLNFVNNFSEVNVELLNELRDGPLKKLAEEDKKDANEIVEDLSQNLQKINHHGKRADSIVKGMLQHSRISTGVKEPTDINKLADEYLRLAYHGLRAKDKSFNVILKTDFDDSIGNISIIPQDIGRVLLNLYNNAFYAVNEKKQQRADLYEPKISVSTKKINSKAEIKVADNGMGIQQKVIDKIFQPFFTTKPTGQGTGLGLSLSYDIIKAHGGEIKVETKEGEGAEFIIMLPIV